MEHIPVLLNEVVGQFSYLSDRKDSVFVDGTLGNAGHGLGIAKQFNKENLKFIGIDKDQSALELAKEKIQEAGLYENFTLVNNDFKNVKEILQSTSLPQNDKSGTVAIDGALIDLGVSSMQLDQKERGFSFEDPNAELDMRMDQSQSLDAKTILNNYQQVKLESILKNYGEEPFFKTIAKNICTERKNKPFRFVGDLLSVLEKSIPSKIRATSKKHFATRTFQALRIETNNELLGLDKAIDDFVDILKPNSRLAIITFHSLEDRIVKNKFRELGNPCICPKDFPVCMCQRKPKVKILTKKPITASEEEINNNPRSRSAKLRVVEKI